MIEGLSSELLVLDGGLATELERRGADLRDPLWSAKLLLDDPALIRGVHLDYFRAGARVAVSASYQASFPGFLARGLSKEQAADLMRRSVRLAQEARADFLAEAAAAGPLIVAASLGCYGAFLHDGGEYRGDYGLTRRQLIDWHRPRLETLLEARPELLACETIPCLVEAEALVRLVEEYDVPAWLGCSCRDDEHLCHGEPFVEAVHLANDCRRVVAVGVNCTPPVYLEELLRRAAEVPHKTLLAYPNSGESWDATTGRWSTASQGFCWQTGVRQWLDVGARWIGGCCRTTPATIASIAAVFAADERG